MCGMGEFSLGDSEGACMEYEGHWCKMMDSYEGEDGVWEVARTAG
jgi:hypothetical protein